MWKKHIQRNDDKPSTGTHISLEALIALRHKAGRDCQSVKKKSHDMSVGQNLVKLRGRGIEFDTTREYQPGDDVRRMAWRVTARNLKAHIKAYHAERDRTVWLGIDLSPSLFFGTRCMFKSVCSIQQATRLGWSHLRKRERIGACIAASEQLSIYPPTTNERDFLLILKTLSQHSHSLPAFTEKNRLHELLSRLQQTIRSGHALFIFSDFFQFDDSNQKLILHLAQRAHVTLMFVYDPFEATSPPAYPYVVTDGKECTLFNTENANTQIIYQQQFTQKLTELVDFSQKNNIAFQRLCTTQSQGAYHE